MISEPFLFERFIGKENAAQPEEKLFEFLVRRLDRLCERGYLQFERFAAGTPGHGLLPVMTELARRKLPAPPVEVCEAMAVRMQVVFQNEKLGFAEEFLDCAETLVERTAHFETVEIAYLVGWAAAKNLELGEIQKSKTLRFFNHEILKKLAAANPDSEVLQRDLAISLRQFGDLENKLGNLETAKNYWHRGLEILERRLAMNPQSVQLQQDVRVTRERLGI